MRRLDACRRARAGAGRLPPPAGGAGGRARHRPLARDPRAGRRRCAAEDAPRARGSRPGPPRPAPRRAEPLVGRDARGRRAGRGLGARRGRAGGVGGGRRGPPGSARRGSSRSWRAGRGPAGGRSALGGALELEGAPPLAPWSEALRELVRDASPPPEGSLAGRPRPPLPGRRAAVGPRPAGALGGRPSSSACGSSRRSSSWSPGARARRRCVAGARGPAPGRPGERRAARPPRPPPGRPAGAGDRDPPPGAGQPRPRSRPRRGPVARAAAPGGLPRGRCPRPRPRRSWARRRPASAPETARARGRGRPGQPPARPRGGARGRRRPRARRGLRGAIRGPLGRLDPAARSLVDLAAAAGRPLEPAEAADADRPRGAAGRPSTTPWPRACCVEDGGRRVRFGHDLVREACYAELTPRPPRGGAPAAWRRPSAAAPAAGPPRWPATSAWPASPRRRGATWRRRPRTRASLGALDEAAAYLAEAVSLAGRRPARGRETSGWRSPTSTPGAPTAPRWTRPSREAERLLGGARDAGRPRPGARLPRPLAAHHALLPGRGAGGQPPRARADRPRRRRRARGAAAGASSAAWAESVAGDPAEVPRLIEAHAQHPRGHGRPGARGRARARARHRAAAGRRLRRGGPGVRARRRPRAPGRPPRHRRARPADRRRGRRVRGRRRARARALRPPRGLPLAGRALESQLRAARAHALSRLGRHDEAVAAAEENAERAAAGRPPRRGPGAARPGRDPAGGRLARPGGRAPAGGARGGRGRAPARARPAAPGRGAGAAPATPPRPQEELERVPFEPVGPADMPEALVPRISRVQGLIAAARGDPGRAGAPPGRGGARLAADGRGAGAAARPTRRCSSTWAARRWPGWSSPRGSSSAWRPTGWGWRW